MEETVGQKAMDHNPKKVYAGFTKVIAVALSCFLLGGIGAFAANKLFLQGSSSNGIIAPDVDDGTTPDPAELPPYIPSVKPTPEPEPEPEPEPAPAPQPVETPSHAASFSRTWNGSYEGHNGDLVYTRPITFTFDEVTESGELHGTVDIVVQEADPSERISTYRVDGVIDWDSGYFYVEGTSWVTKGDLDNMRTFEGTVDFSSNSASGKTWNDEGNNLHEWRATA